MTGVLLTGVFATASIGQVSGLLEGNAHLLYGVVVPLGWSAVITFVVLKLLSLFVQIRVSLQQELGASIFRNMARHCSSSII